MLLPMNSLPVPAANPEQVSMLATQAAYEAAKFSPITQTLPAMPEPRGQGISPLSFSPDPAMPDRQPQALYFPPANAASGNLVSVPASPQPAQPVPRMQPLAFHPEPALSINTDVPLFAPTPPTYAGPQTSTGTLTPNTIPTLRTEVARVPPVQQQPVQAVAQPTVPPAQSPQVVAQPVAAQPVAQQAPAQQPVAQQTPAQQPVDYYAMMNELFSQPVRTDVGSVDQLIAAQARQTPQAAIAYLSPSGETAAGETPPRPPSAMFEADVPFAGKNYRVMYDPISKKMQTMDRTGAIRDLRSDMPLFEAATPMIEAWSESPDGMAIGDPEEIDGKQLTPIKAKGSTFYYDSQTGSLFETDPAGFVVPLPAEEADVLLGASPAYQATRRMVARREQVPAVADTYLKNILEYSNQGSPSLYPQDEYDQAYQRYLDMIKKRNEDVIKKVETAGGATVSVNQATARAPVGGSATASNNASAQDSVTGVDILVDSEIESSARELALFDMQRKYPQVSSIPGPNSEVVRGIRTTVKDVLQRYMAGEIPKESDDLGEEAYADFYNSVNEYISSPDAPNPDYGWNEYLREGKRNVSPLELIAGINDLVSDAYASQIQSGEDLANYRSRLTEKVDALNRAAGASAFGRSLGRVGSSILSAVSIGGSGAVRYPELQGLASQESAASSAGQGSAAPRELPPLTLPWIQITAAGTQSAGTLNPTALSTAMTEAGMNLPMSTWGSSVAKVDQSLISYGNRGQNAIKPTLFNAENGRAETSRVDYTSIGDAIKDNLWNSLRHARNLSMGQGQRGDVRTNYFANNRRSMSDPERLLATRLGDSIANDVIAAFDKADAISASNSSAPPPSPAEAKLEYGRKLGLPNVNSGNVDTLLKQFFRGLVEYKIVQWVGTPRANPTSRSSGVPRFDLNQIGHVDSGAAQYINASLGRGWNVPARPNVNLFAPGTSIYGGGGGRSVSINLHSFAPQLAASMPEEVLGQADADFARNNNPLLNRMMQQVQSRFSNGILVQPMFTPTGLKQLFTGAMSK